MVQGKEQKRNDSVHAGMSFGAAEPGSRDQLGNHSSHVQLYHGSRAGTKGDEYTIQICKGHLSSAGKSLLTRVTALSHDKNPNPCPAFTTCPAPALGTKIGKPAPASGAIGLKLGLYLLVVHPGLPRTHGLA